MHSVKYILKYFYKYKVNLIFFTFLTCIIWVISLTTPIVLGRFIDSLISIKSKRVVINYLIFLLAVWSTELIISYILNTISTKLRNKIAFDLNYNIIEHVKKLPISFFNNTDVTYLNQRINSDSFSVISFFIDNFINLLLRIVAFIYTLWFVLRIDLTIAVSFISIVPLYGLIYYLFRKPIYKKSYEFKETQNKFVSIINEQFMNIKLMKINSWFNTFSIILQENFKKLLNIAVDYSKTSFLFSNIDRFIGYIVNIILFFYVGFKIIDGKLTIGTFTLLNSYLTILLGNLSYFFNLGKMYQDFLVSFNRIQEILNINVEKNGNIIISELHTIEFKNVSFSYVDNKKLLENINYKIRKGKIYCIIGKNGIGKSTFIDLLLGLDQNYDGEILYNSIDINNIDLYSAREKNFSVVEQEPSLLSETLLNNVSFGIKSVNISAVEHWCIKLGIMDSITGLAEGFNTNIVENSNNISGGEKQKIAQLRAFIKDADVLILDEPTSALDSCSIKSLCKILNEIKKNKIIILVTHNKDVISISDEVIELMSS